MYEKSVKSRPAKAKERAAGDPLVAKEQMASVRAAPMVDMICVRRCPNFLIKGNTKK